MKKFLLPLLAIQRSSDSLDMYIDNLSSSFESMNFEDAEGQHLARKINALASKVNVARHDNIATHVGIGSNATITGLITQSKGDLNIIVTRETVTIAADLPFVLFAKNDFDAGYISSLKSALPAGGTCVVSKDSATGDVLFTHTVGGNTDVVRVSLQATNTNYSAFLSAMNQNYFTTKFILYTISDSTKTDQYSKILNFGLISALGSMQANQLNINSRKMTWDFQSDRVNVLIPEQKITADFGFLQKIRQTAGFQIGFNVFMSDRVNLNNRLV